MNTQDHDLVRPIGRNSRLWLCALVGLQLLAGASVRASAQRQPLKPVPPGIAAPTRIRPRQLDLSPERPAEVKRIPSGLTAPYYTTLQIGPKQRAGRFFVLVDAPKGKPSRIFVDSNGNGDLTDDPPVTWSHSTYAGRESDHLMKSEGSAVLQVRYDRAIVPTRVALWRFDTTEPARIAQFLPLYCASDYTREGSVTIGKRAYHVFLADALTQGDFRGSGTPGQSGIFLLIDVNGNGKIDPRGETFDAFEPFNIGGATYEVKGLDAAGTGLEIVKSDRSVAEVLPPPDLGVGKTVLPFERADTSGKLVRFPGGYHGKTVLLYFWATWCGDCNREVPYVTRAFTALHDRGLEIVGVSLDHPNAEVQLAAFTKDRGMAWPEIYDGKGWDADLAQLYYIRHTPTALLVNGDTGVILAAGSDLMESRLQETISHYLKSN